MLRLSFGVFLALILYIGLLMTGSNAQSGACRELGKKVRLLYSKISHNFSLQFKSAFILLFSNKISQKISKL